MNIGEILVANGTSMLLLFFLMICRRMARQKRRPVDVVFTVIIWIAFMGSFLEPFTFLLDGREGTLFRIVNLFSNSLEYACTATAATLWMWYVDLSLYHEVKRLRRYLPQVGVWLCLIALLIVNVFGGFLFTVDEHNVYARQPVGYIFYVYLVLSYLTSIIVYYRFRATHGKAQFFPIWMFLTPLLLSIAIQIPFYGISVSYLGCSVGLVGIYLNLQSKKSLVDGLTGLFNRGYIEHALLTAEHSRRYVYSGIMLDIDRFKQINDTYGHSTGDHALMDAAKIIMNATDRDELAFRFAGDEFIVLVRVPVSQVDQLEAKTVAVEERIRAEADKFNRDNEMPYKLVFSMGHAAYDPSLGEDVFFHNIDTEMYKDKQLHRAKA